MCNTCFHAELIGDVIQICNVPEDLHRQLKSRSAMAGMSLSDYLLHEVRQIAECPTLAEFLTRLRGLPIVNIDVLPADAIREERERA
jgi:plasmid stability protein